MFVYILINVIKVINIILIINIIIFICLSITITISFYILLSDKVINIIYGILLKKIIRILCKNRNICVKIFNFYNKLDWSVYNT